MPRQAGDVQAKLTDELAEREKRQIAFTPFNSADVASINAGFVSKLLL
jgi:hypothetical protein